VCFIWTLPRWHFEIGHNHAYHIRHYSSFTIIFPFHLTLNSVCSLNSVGPNVTVEWLVRLVLVLGKSRVKMAVRRRAILGGSGIFRGFPQFYGQITGLCLENMSRSLRFTLFTLYKLFFTSMHRNLSTYKSIPF
jgi:hypothetical protein